MKFLNIMFVEMRCPSLTTMHCRAHVHQVHGDAEPLLRQMENIHTCFLNWVTSYELIIVLRQFNNITDTKTLQCRGYYQSTECHKNETYIAEYKQGKNVENKQLR